MNKRTSEIKNILAPDYRTYLQPRDFALWNVAEVHEQAADGIFAARDQDPLVLIDGVLRNPLHEIGNRPIHAVLEALGLGQFPHEHRLALFDGADGALLDRITNVSYVAVSRIVPRVVLREGRHGRGADVEPPPPGLELLLSVPLSHHLLGETGQLAVHAFVEAPSLYNRKPEAVHFVHYVPGRFESSTQPRSVHDIESK
jgi:hypothetical protein